MRFIFCAGEMDTPELLVRVLYNFEYSKDGRNIWMKEGESLTLLKKTNPDWWQVIRVNDKRPFYVPAAYVEEVSLEKPEEKYEFQNSFKLDSRRISTLTRDKRAEKNLFKEFPVCDPKESEKCSDDREKCSNVKKENSLDKFCDIDRTQGVCADDPDVEASRFLHDKRKSWAAEELVSELTQMAIARTDPAESDYVNLTVEGERFVIASNEEDEIHMQASLFWQPSVRNNPMSSSDELDNSDSLGQNHRVAWQSKYSLSSEGDKTDESMQSFHSLGNESVTSRERPWRNGEEDRDSSPYAHVLQASSSIISIDATGTTAGLKLSESLEKLAEQIKFPGEVGEEEDEVDKVDDVEDILVAPIAPPREYEAPVYENVDVSLKATARLDQDTGVGSEEDLRGETSVQAAPHQDEKEAASTQSGPQQTVISYEDDEQSRDEIDTEDTLDTVDDCDDDCSERSEDGDDAGDEATPDTLDAAEAEDDGDPKPTPRLLIEGLVDVKQKIALWNSSGVDRAVGAGGAGALTERQDRFDEDASGLLGPGGARRATAFDRGRGGVIKSASESRVSALRGLYVAASAVSAAPEASDSRSGSEEFLDAAPGRARPVHQRSPLQLDPEGDNLDASDSGLSNRSDEAALSENRRRRAALVRSRRVESCRRYQRDQFAPAANPGAPSAPRPQSPPPPSPGQEAARLLPAGWAEFHTADGRSFYYHGASGQRRWKPPRRRPRQDSGRSLSSSPLQGVQIEEAERVDAEDEAGATVAVLGTPSTLPQGWRAVMDQSGQLCYIHPHHGVKWFSSSDDNGRLYFFEENGCESTWNLPDISASNYQDEASHSGDLQVASSGAKDSMGEKIVLSEPNDERHTLRTTKSRSMVIVDSGIKDTKIITSPKNWPQLFDGSMYVLKEGPMYRTKITENGKKLRKNWASCHVVLTELFLLLFRDAKSFAAMKSSVQASTALRPELSVDLNGALIDQVDRGEKASVTSRKNVFLVSTVLGLQVLFQCDSSQQAEEWYNAVHAAIHSLPSGFDSCPRMKLTKEMDRLFGEAPSLDHTKKFSRIGRSKSVKIKNKDGSIEDLTVSVSERQTKIKARLKKFFNRRPTMESLVKKGIWKDEPAFGCYLDQVCGSESPKVPLFVQRCVAVIERNEDNMKTDGLYRASGNLSQVQKIRLQIDQNNLLALEQEDDVHVLTGALKLFFRELKEPLIPYTAFSKAIKASTLQNKKEKLAQFRDIVKSLPSANHDTLKFLLKHLLKVTGYQEFNRMHIPNLAIVFGPTLMWPEQESLNMALDLMQQNLVIEAFLLDFDHIFR